MLKKTPTRENSPARSLTETEPTVAETVPWKTGVAMLKKTQSLDVSPVKKEVLPTVTLKPVSVDEGAKFEKKAAETDVAWKSGVQMLRKPSLTPTQGENSDKPQVGSTESVEGPAPVSKRSGQRQLSEERPQVVLKRTPQKPKAFELESQKLQLKPVECNS